MRGSGSTCGRRKRPLLVARVGRRAHALALVLRARLSMHAAAQSTSRVEPEEAGATRRANAQPRLKGRPARRPAFQKIDPYNILRVRAVLFKDAVLSVVFLMEA